MPELGIEDLYSLDDAPVRSAVSATFVRQLQSAASVKAVFFPSAPSTVAPQSTEFVDGIATALVCSTIALSSLYGFSHCVDAGAASQFWQTRLTHTNAQAIAEGQALYGWAFPDYCKSSRASFRDYMSSGAANWGRALAEKVTTDQFINGEMLKILAQPNWLEHLNLIFYKLERLDSGALDQVLRVWTARYPERGIVNTWNQRTLIPAQNFLRVPEEFIGQVNAAISVKSVIGTTYTPGHGGPSAEPGRSWDRYGFGVAVQRFLEARPRQLGLTTGKSPDNDPDKGAGCFVAGTRVLLAGGREIAIEEARAGHLVVGKDGGVSRQTGEHVITQLEQGEYVYGIDDGQQRDDPFFSAGHLFWTPQGWKAIDPQLALIENPDREVGELKVGDTVLRLRTSQPVTYDEVRIRGFTRRFLAAGSFIYGLHLVDGPYSYHANGYLVGMNYPQLTVQRLSQGFARLTEAERQQLERGLTELMPLLKRSVGPFVEPALRRALIAARHPSVV